MIDLNFSLDSGQDSEIGTIGGQGSTAAVERRLTRISLVRINMKPYPVLALRQYAFFLCQLGLGPISISIFGFK